MNGQPAEAQPGPKSSATPGWQLAVVAVVLAAVALCLFLPVGVVAAFFAGLMAFAWGGVMLERVGALEPALFQEAGVLALLLLAAGGGFAALMGAIRLFNALAAPGPERQPSVLPWPLRWPWFVLGAALLVVDAKLIPGAGGRSSVPGVAGAAVLATAGWLSLTVPYLLFRLGKAVLGMAWRLSRASPFGAGFVTLGGAGGVAIMLALGAVADILSQASTTARSGSECRVGEPAIDCFRRVLAESNPRSGSVWEQTFAAPSRGQGSAGASSVFSSGRGGLTGSLSGSTGGGPPSDFHQCLEAYETNPSLKSQARSIAGNIVGYASAQDVVGQTLIDVCLHPRALDSFEPFFLRSVKNRALNWNRSPANGRRCSLDVLPEPVCDVRPDDEFVREETRRAVHNALCALSENDREVLDLRYFEGLGEAEIAQRLNIAYDAARQRLKRARDRLRSEFVQRCQ